MSDPNTRIEAMQGYGQHISHPRDKPKMPVKPPLRITHTAGSDAGTTRLTLEGEVDLATSPFLAMSLGEIGGCIELDLDKVDFMDSSGLKVLLDHRNRLDEDGGSLHVVKISPQVQRLFELSSVLEVFDYSDRR